MATNRTMFTGLDDESFEAGLSWVRSNKQLGLTLLVIDMGLQESHVNKLKELSVKVTPNTKKTGNAQADIFNTFVDYCDKVGGIGSYLFWDVEVKTDSANALWGSSLFVAPALKDKDVTTLVFPLSSIDDRVRIGSQFESKQDAYFSGLISGCIKDWKLFVGFYNTMIETGIIETAIPSRNLVLNLFALYFPERVESKPVEYEISALQLENQE